MLSAIILLVVAVSYRIVLGFAGSDNSWLPNFAPLAAIALCAPSVLPRRMAFALPMLILVASDVVLNLHYGASILSVDALGHYLPIALVTWMGMRMAGNRGFGSYAVASIASSTLFYAITNSVSWLTDAGYAKTAAGWLQAMTVGLPGYAPTWTFFRNSAVSDLVFTMLFVACIAMSRKPDAMPIAAEPVHA